MCPPPGVEAALDMLRRTPSMLSATAALSGKATIAALACCCEADAVTPINYRTLTIRPSSSPIIGPHRTPG